MNMFMNVCLESYEWQPMLSENICMCCKVNRDYYLLFEVQKWYVVVVFFCAQTYVNRDVHIKCNMADLSENLLEKWIHENAPKMF